MLSVWTLHIPIQGVYVFDMILRTNGYYFTSRPCRGLIVKQPCVCCHVGTELFSIVYMECFLWRVELVITTRHTCPVVKDDATRRLKQQMLDFKPNTLSWATEFERQPSNGSAVLRRSPVHGVTGWKRCSWNSIVHYPPQSVTDHFVLGAESHCSSWGRRM